MICSFVITYFVFTVSTDRGENTTSSPPLQGLFVVSDRTGGKVKFDFAPHRYRTALQSITDHMIDLIETPVLMLIDNNFDFDSENRFVDFLGVCHNLMMFDLTDRNILGEVGSISKHNLSR